MLVLGCALLREKHLILSVTICIASVLLLNIDQFGGRVLSIGIAWTV